MSSTDPNATRSPLHDLFLEGALSLISEAVITVDLAGRIVYANAAATALVGMSPEDLLGAKVESALLLFDAVTGETVTDALEQSRHDPASVPVTRKAVLLNGSDTPVIIEYRVNAILDGQAAPVGAAIAFRDIMRRRQAEQALHSSEAALLANASALYHERERAQVTLNSIADSVVSTDFRGRITFLNNIAEQMTGWSQSDALGRELDSVFRLIDGETRKFVSCPAMLAIIEDRAVEPAAQTILVSRTGREIPISNRAAPIHNRDGSVAGAVMVAHDVSESRETTKKLTRLALFDPLTGLPNRLVLMDRLNQSIELAQRHNQMLAVLFIDLDRFKPVNDQLGHACGDGLLQQVAARLTQCVRGADTVCRLGGDEFVILLSEIAHERDPSTCAEKVRAAMQQPFLVDGHTIEIDASVGRAIWPRDGSEADLLLSAADKDMYKVKAAGREQVGLS